MKPIEFHPDAAQEASDIANWYEALKLGLGEDFKADMGSTLSKIQQNPEMYATESVSVRVAPLNRFPYSLYYANLPDRIWIVAVGHQSRRPGYWKRRLPG